MLLVLAAGLLVAGCGARGGRWAAPQATSTAPPSSPVIALDATAPIATPVPSPAPATRAAAPPAATALPAPQAAPEPFSLGAPAGDAYDLSSLAADPAGERAVVYAGDSEAGGPVLAVVDLARGEVLRHIPLRSTGYASGGTVLLSPDGRQGYAVDRYAATLTLFDPHAGDLDQAVPVSPSPPPPISPSPPPAIAGVTEALLSPDGERLYAIMDREGLRAFDTADLAAGGSTPIWSMTDAPYLELAVNGDVVAATRGGDQPALVAFDGATGRQIAGVPLEDVTARLAPGPNGGWLISAGFNPVRLLRLDAGLEVVAEAEARSGGDPYYDAPRDRYLVTGWADGSGMQQEILSYAQDDLAAALVRVGPPADIPDSFAPYGEEGLLGLQRGDGASVSLLKPADLSPARKVVLGVKLADMALDEAGRRLFVADDQGRIHVLGLPGGELRAVWDGAAPIALDAANRRLYANRADGVVALEATTGAEIARFPQHGMPAPDPNRDLVYITDQGVSMYNRAGHAMGRLDGTFPVDPGMNPNPRAVAARVNPVDGTLVATINNGSTGSSNRSHLRLYPPEATRPITVTGPFHFVGDLAFDPGGDLLVSYSNAMNREALQRLDSAGRELGRLSGRTGALALDPTTGLLYVAGGGALARVNAGAMQLLDVHRGPSDVNQLLLHPGLRQLYARREDSSRITVLNMDELEPVEMRPVAVDGLPSDAGVNALDFWTVGGESILYATTTWDHYRAAVTPGSDGSDLHWERLPVGSLPAWGEITVAGDALFRAGAGEYGGDGVFRSLDGDESWELLAAGLTDLRPAQPVLARGAGEAYFVGRTGGILAWRPGAADAAGSWERIVATERDYESPGELSLAPDGTLFLASWSALQRSSDGGRTWSDLPLPGDGVKIAGFDPDYARTRTLLSFLCTNDGCQVLRSRDGGETQLAVLVLPPYSTPLQLRARAGRPELYLYAGGYPAPQLYRSTDGGGAWQAADPGALQDTTSMTLAPDGRLWFGAKGSVRVVDPDTISWSPLFPSPPPRVSPSPGPRVSPSPPPRVSPSPSPCPGALPDLGCPISPEQSVTMARQPFERGRLVWIGGGSGLADWERVVVVLNGTASGAWQRHPDAWQEGQPESDPAIQPPVGLYQPVRGFGKVWREQMGGPGAPIGWASAPEEGLTGAIQAFQRGVVLRLGAERLLLRDDGFWRTD